MRLLVPLLAVAALVGGATASGAPFSVPHKLVGTWGDDFINKLTIKSTGRVHYQFGQGERSDGTFSATSTRAIFGPAAVCSGRGAYFWKVKGRHLTFRVTADRCLVRRNFIATTWARK